LHGRRKILLRSFSGARAYRIPLGGCWASRRQSWPRDCSPDLTLPGHLKFLLPVILLGKRHNGQPVPGVAPRNPDGKFAARQIKRAVEGKPREKFEYSIRQSGDHRRSRVGQFADPISGYFAWMAWLSFTLLFLVGFRNRLFVMSEWRGHISRITIAVDHGAGKEMRGEAKAKRIVLEAPLSQNRLSLFSNSKRHAEASPCWTLVELGKPRFLLTPLTRPRTISPP